MLIHTFAENAVKYAFRPVNGSGRLEIRITRQPAKYCITVTDNGPGLKGTGKIPKSDTGKGLEILDEMIKLYYSLKKVKISYSLEDLMENGFCKGLRVVIEIF
jgi:two-component sensor histidine kinase